MTSRYTDSPHWHRVEIFFPNISIVWCGNSLPPLKRGFQSQTAEKSICGGGEFACVGVKENWLVACEASDFSIVEPNNGTNHEQNTHSPFVQFLNIVMQLHAKMFIQCWCFVVFLFISVRFDFVGTWHARPEATKSDPEHMQCGKGRDEMEFYCRQNMRTHLDKEKEKYLNIRFSWAIRFTEFSGSMLAPIVRISRVTIQHAGSTTPFTAIISNVVSGSSCVPAKRNGHFGFHTAFTILFAHTY